MNFSINKDVLVVDSVMSGVTAAITTTSLETKESIGTHFPKMIGNNYLSQGRQ